MYLYRFLVISSAHNLSPEVTLTCVTLSRVFTRNPSVSSWVHPVKPEPTVHGQVYNGRDKYYHKYNGSIYAI